MAETLQSSQRANGSLPPITFVLPVRGASGGVRVTVEMASRLLEHGHQARIAYRAHRAPSVRWLIEMMRYVRWKLRGGRHNDWLSHFRGRLERFHTLNEISFRPGEIVVAVGTFAIQEVNALQADVLKLRFCHGFREDLPQLTRIAWGLPMPTITVSPTLVERIKDLTGEDPIAIIPNGISSRDYFTEKDVLRDGIGSVYSSNFKKDPQTILRLFEEIAKRWPDVPLYCFGAERRPADLHPKVTYVQSPAVEKARELYNRSILWFVASRSEGFCLPMLEAMACGAAVVSSRHDSAPGLVTDGLNALMAPIGDIGAFMEKFDLILHDPAIREHLVKEGYKTVQQHNWDQAVEQMERFLTDFSLQGGVASTPTGDARDGD